MSEVTREPHHCGCRAEYVSTERYSDDGGRLVWHWCRKCGAIGSQVLGRLFSTEPPRSELLWTQPAAERRGA